MAEPQHQQGGLTAEFDAAGIEEAEPWESWETKLVLYSIGIAVGVLAVGGTLVNIFLL